MTGMYLMLALIAWLGFVWAVWSKAARMQLRCNGLARGIRVYARSEKLRVWRWNTALRSPDPWLQ